MWVFGLECVVPPLITFEKSYICNSLATVLLFPLCDQARPWFRFSTRTSSVAGLAFFLVASTRATLVICSALSYLLCKLWLCPVLIAACALLTDVDRFPWKSQTEFCVVRPTHQFKSLGFVCSPSFFSLPAGCRLFSRGMIFTRARVSLALLSLMKNGGLLVVYRIVGSDVDLPFQVGTWCKHHIVVPR